jgi:hypothetical protein
MVVMLALSDEPFITWCIEDNGGKKVVVNLCGHPSPVLEKVVAVMKSLNVPLEDWT